MKRKPIIAGNWKMNKTRDEALDFIYAVNLELPSLELVETVVCPPTIYLRDLVKREEENLKIGSQNMSQFDEGAYTGEVSGLMLKTTGVHYVILGHSERRAYFGDTDEIVHAKIVSALKYNLTPIICVGETLETRQNNHTEAFIQNQIEKAISGFTKDAVKQFVVAYEPIWAIGTGQTATPKQANDTISFIRQTIAKLYDKETADHVRILYGGSVNTKNIDDLLAQKDIDGALVGGASLDPKSFLYLAHAAVHKDI